MMNATANRKKNGKHSERPSNATPGEDLGTSGCRRNLNRSGMVKTIPHRPLGNKHAFPEKVEIFGWFSLDFFVVCSDNAKRKCIKNLKHGAESRMP
jgi:hypothetical protein